MKHKGILFMAAGVLTGFFTFFTLTNTDIWWHLASAREMLAQKRFLTSDPFTFTPSIEPWINVHWFFQLIVYGFYSLAGVWGILIAKALFLVAAVYLILGGTLRQKMSFASLGVFTLLIFFIRFEFLARPIFVSLFCIGASIYILESFVKNNNAKVLMWLIPLQIFWANCQGLFILGPFVTFCYLLGFKKREAGVLPMKFAGIFILPLLQYVISIFNPAGWRIWFYPFRLFGKISPSDSNLYSLNISENLPLFSLGQTQDAYMIYLVLGLSLMLGYMLLRPNNLFCNPSDSGGGLKEPGKILYSHRIAYVALLGGLLFLALISKRNVILFVFVGGALTSGLMSQSFLSEGKITAKAFGSRLSSVAFISLIAFLSISHLNLLAKSPFKSPVSPFRYPEEAVNFIRQHKLEGNIFNAARYGGYLEFFRVPPKKTFIDGRFVIKEPRFFREFLRVLDFPETFPEMAEKFELSHVLIPSAIFVRYQKLACWLYQSPNWNLAFLDGSSVLFVNAHKYPEHRIDLGDYQEVHKVEQHLQQKWGRESQIFKEAQMYLRSTVKGLTKENLGSY